MILIEKNIPISILFYKVITFFLYLDETFAFLSKNTATEAPIENHGGFRVRQSIREAYHKVVDKPVEPKSSASPSDSVRIRQSAKGIINNI